MGRAVRELADALGLLRALAAMMKSCQWVTLQVFEWL